MRSSRASSLAVLSMAMLSASAANYLLNVVFARLLTPAEFGDATLIVTIMLGLTAAAVSLQLVTARAVAAGEPAREVRSSLRRRALEIAVPVSLGLVLAAPLLADLFSAGSAVPFAILGLGMPIYLVQAVDRGVLQGERRFARLSLSLVVEALSRVVLSLGLVAIGLGVAGATIGLSLSFFASAAVVRPVRDRPERPDDRRWVDHSGAGRATALLLTGQIVINNGDVAIAKWAFDPDTAGTYSAAALVGRAVFFASWAVVNAVFPDAAAASTDTKRSAMLRNAVLVVGSCGAAITAAVAVFDRQITALMFGGDYPGAAELLAPYAAATTFFAVANLIATVDLGGSRSGTGTTILLGAVVQTVLLGAFGSDPVAMVWVQLLSMAALLIMTTGVHRYQVNAHDNVHRPQLSPSAV